MQHPASHPFGPWFDVERLARPKVGSGAGTASGWLGFEEFLTPDVLGRVVEATHARLRERGPLGHSRSEVRAVASTVVLGLFSRVLSPAIGAEVAGLPGYVADVSSTYWRQAESGPGDLGSTATASTATATPGTPEQVLERVALPLAEAFEDQFGVPDQVLRGNLAAAVVGACDVLRAGAPSLARRAASVRSRLFTHDLLAGTCAGTGTGAGTDRGEAPFVRTSCCQIHRLPVGFVCGSCPLVASDTPTARRLQGRSVARR